MKKFTEKTDPQIITIQPSLFDIYLESAMPDPEENFDERFEKPVSTGASPIVFDREMIDKFDEYFPKPKRKRNVIKSSQKIIELQQEQVF